MMAQMQYHTGIIYLLAALLQLPLLVLAMMGFGVFLLRRCELTDRCERSLLGFALGYMCLSALVFGLCAAHALQPWLFWLVIALGIALLYSSRRQVWPLWTWFPALSWWMKALLALLVIIPGLFALLPPIFFDSLMYHLAVPAYYIQKGGFAAWPGNFFASLPMATEMIYLFTLLGRSVYLATLFTYVTWIFVFLLLWYWQTQSFTTRSWSMAALLFCSLPEVVFLASVPKPDSAEFLFVALAVYCGLRLHAKGRGAYLVLGGLSWGMAIAIKYNAAFYLMAFLLAYAVFEKIHWQKKVKTIVILCALALLILSPWLAKNMYYHGNPTFPYFNSLFHAPHWTHGQTQLFFQESRGSSTNSFHDLYRFLYDMFFSPYKLGMTAVWGFSLLVFLPLLLLRRPGREDKILIFTAVVAFAAMMPFTRLPRYFLPSMALLALPIAHSFESSAVVKTFYRKLLTAVLVVFVALNLVMAAAMMERYSRGFLFFGQKKFLGDSTAHPDYLSIVPYYRAARFINTRLAADECVLLFGEPRSFYIGKPFLAYSFLDENDLITLVKKMPSCMPIIQELKNRGITHIMYSPVSLNMQQNKSYLYRLNQAEIECIQRLFSALTVVYQDERNIIYALQKKS